jgi:hypothetical protein
LPEAAEAAAGAELSGNVEAADVSTNNGVGTVPEAVNDVDEASPAARLTLGGKSPRDSRNGRSADRIRA